LGKIPIEGLNVGFLGNFLQFCGFFWVGFAGGGHARQGEKGKEGEKEQEKKREEREKESAGRLEDGEKVFGRREKKGRKR
jgi:hypothetical protein